MRVLICGGRDFGSDKQVSFLIKYLNNRFPFDESVGVFPENLTIITGGARGADSFSHAWAVQVGANTVVYPAQWDRYGKKAGYLRNKQMLEEGKPDLVIAFPGGAGTANMVSLAKRAEVPVEIVKYNEE